MRKAFTLLEMLIVVLILGFLAAIVIPRFTAPDKGQNEEQMLYRQIHSRLRDAQYVLVAKQPDEKTYVIRYHLKFPGFSEDSTINGVPVSEFDPNRLRLLGFRRPDSNEPGSQVWTKPLFSEAPNGAPNG